MHASTVSILLLQVVVVLGLSRIMGVLAVRVRQPKVVGEMLAGIMLGPSFFGWLAPHLATAVFPSDSLRLLNVLAQLGVVLFLFLVGLELNPKLIRDRGHSAVLISHVSIIAPLLLGAVLSLFLYPRVFNDAPKMRFTAVALFLGAAMSITAFPVLARILTERGLQRSRVGAITIACAAVDDVSAWCMLAFVVAVARAEGVGPGLRTAALSAAYVLLILFVIRPFLRRLRALYEHGGPAQTVFAVVLVLTLLSAATTEFIGIHALFGAFLMGAIMPKDARFVRLITERLEDFVVIILLPLFFAYAGLRTQIGLLNSPHLWGLTGLVVLTACLGKFGGSAVAARVSGMDWRESSAIGILMNTRGLVELVILTVGLQIGVITDAVFAMMVIMALVTTALTTPVLHWVYPERLLKQTPIDDTTARAEFGVVVPVSRSESAGGLGRIAAALGRDDEPSKIYGVTLLPTDDYDSLRFDHDSEDESCPPALQALRAVASHIGVPAEMIALATRDVASDIAHVARLKKADLVLIGSHRPVFSRTILGGTVHRVLTGADTDVGILVDRGIAANLDILVPYQGSLHDDLAVALAARIARSPRARATVLQIVTPGHRQRSGTAPAPRRSFPGSLTLRVDESDAPVDAVLRHKGEFNFLLIGLGEEWGLGSHIFGLEAERIAHEWNGSLLLVRKYVPIVPPAETVARSATTDQTASAGVTQAPNNR